MNRYKKYRNSYLVLILALISACAISPEQRAAEENRRMQVQRAKYQWQVNFCSDKGITPQSTSFNSCLDWAKAEQDLQAAQAARCSTNWFAVSSAFAQPQLGGFASSLGSASQELAKQNDRNGCK
jgi:hypothetical protein